MTTRKALAVATLAALPMFVAASQSLPAPLATHAEPPAWGMTPQPAGPHWLWAFGVGGDEALAFGIAGAIMCVAFGPVGGAACGITGAL